MAVDCLSYTSKEDRCRGIDEAGLGPRLGPLVMAAVDSAATDDEQSRRRFLNNAAGADLAIMDSKILYRRGFAALERVALAVLHYNQTCELRSGLSGLIEPDQLKSLEELPWYASLGSIELPVENREADINSIINRWHRINGDHQSLCFSCRICSAADLNRLFARYDNKATAAATLLAPLLIEGLKRGSVYIDRQGGRRYYGEWLRKELRTEELIIRYEEPRHAVYQLGRRQIHFRVQGEHHYPQVALASVCAKYLRELCMLAFNRYWASAGIKPTAGYPGDAERFMRELNAAGREYDTELMVRSR